MSAELTAQELIADWITEDASDLPDDTPITIKIGNHSIILDKLGNLRAALLPAQTEPDAGQVEGTYDPTTQPFDEPFRHVDRTSEFHLGFLEGVRVSAEEANGVEPFLLHGMSDKYVSIYCTARRDASDAIRNIPFEPCEYCGDGKLTGLPGNACENCNNTGLKYPEFAQ